MKLSIVTKLGLGAMLLVVISTSVTGWLFYSKTTSLLVEEAFTDISDEVRSTGQQLKFKIDTQEKDTLFLAGTPPIQGMLRHLSGEKGDKSTLKQWEKRLQSIFITMLASKSDYLTVRFIGKDGREIVVVRRTENNLDIVNPLQLQDKSKRTYVKETLKIRPGKIYLSEISLNKENGVVTTPYQEVLRSATPIFYGQTNKLSGLLVISSEIGNSLREIHDSVLGTGRDVFITNDHGAYLLHSDKSKTYGFDLGKQYRVQEDIPDVSELYSPDNTDKNIVLESTVKGENYVLNFSKIYFDTEKPERFVAVGMVEPYSQILAHESELLSDVILRIIILTGIVMFFAVAFAFRLTKPIINITSVIDDRIHGREPTAKMPINHKDEIGVLARSFNELMNKVEESTQDYEGINRSLEDRIRERTQRLELSEKRQSSIVDSMADSLVTIDRRGVILSFNKAAIKMFGYHPNEVIGCNVNILMPEPYHSDHDSYLQNYHVTGIKKIIGTVSEVDCVRKNGNIFPAELYVSELELAGQKMYTGILRDVTERRHIEKIKNEFISTVSHELRTPLTSIRGALGLVTGGVVGEVSQQMKDVLNIASNNTQRLLFLINDILDVQKMESGNFNFEFERLKVLPFLEKSIHDNQTYAEENNITFSIENKIDDVCIYADKDRLMQVMVNLLSNAAKFSPKNSEVTLSIARHNGLVRISVTDLGPGIPDEFHSKLFDKFTQSDSSDTKQKGGTGLGLAISKVIVEKHMGIIDFVTHKNAGTTFYLEFSELLQSNEEADEPKQIPLNRKPCILIVDHDIDVTVSLRKKCVIAGYNVDIAYDKAHAREYLEQVSANYKLVILGMDSYGEIGGKFLEELIMGAKTENIHVIALSDDTGNSKEKITSKVLEMVSWMKKPIDQKKLIEIINKLIN
ncbi:MAG: PAS domain S-box protein [Sulfuriflexus sp.]|nr:PAS domain S-box protein [Sulfuriflexus sp.]